jgi:DNA-binding NarL/FixJ family response regulator
MEGSTNTVAFRFLPSWTAVPLRCLIVDDDHALRQEMSAMLEEQGVSVVGGAACGAEALTQLAQSRVDVVLIDIDLRGESGLALTRMLAERANGASFPQMVLISAHDESEYADLIEASPAVGFLAKTELSAAAIRRLLAGADAR